MSKKTPKTFAPDAAVRVQMDTAYGPVRLTIPRGSVWTFDANSRFPIDLSARTYSAAGYGLLTGSTGGPSRAATQPYGPTPTEPEDTE